MNKGSRGSLLSLSEREYVEGGVEQNVRADGRERLAARPIELQVCKMGPLLPALLQSLLHAAFGVNQVENNPPREKIQSASVCVCVTCPSPS